MPHANPVEPLDDKGLTIQETRFERLRRLRRVPLRRMHAAQIHDARSLLRETWRPLAGFALVMVSGTLYMWLGFNQYLHPASQLSLLDALFETTRMLLFEHSYSLPRDWIGVILFFAIPFLGLVFVLQGVIDFGQHLLDKSSRLEDWQVSLASTATNHVIVCGLGRVSYRSMLRLIESNYDVVIIEENWHSEFVRDALALNVPVIHGDARDMTTLRNAGIGRARGLITAINNDLANIEIALAACRLRPDLPTILRIFNEQLDSNLERSRFGPHSAFSASALAAPTLAAAAVCRGIAYALPLPDSLLGISELTVTEGGQLDGLVRTIEARFGVQIIGYYGMNGWLLHVDPLTRLYGGDRLLLLGTLPHLSAAWQHGRTRGKIRETLGMEMNEYLTPDQGCVIVCGLGKVGYRVVKTLYHMNPRPEIVVIYDEATPPAFADEIRALGLRMIQHDARSAETLREAGIQCASAIVAVTSDNLANLHIGLTARHIRRDIHLVLRVFSDVLADQLESMFGIHTAFSTSSLAAPALSAAATQPNTAYAIEVGAKLLTTAALTVQAGDGFAHQAVNQIRARRGILVVSVQHMGTYQVPPPADTLLHPGDAIVVLAEIHTIATLRAAGARPGITSIRATQRLSPPRPRYQPTSPPVHSAARLADNPPPTITRDALLEKLLNTP